MKEVRGFSSAEDYSGVGRWGHNDDFDADFQQL
jgi:hypothetical protein